MELLDKIHAYVTHFALVDRQELVDFVAHARPRTYVKNEMFLREGDQCTELLFVNRGSFRYFLTKDGDDFTKDFCLDSSNPFCTGFSSFITQTPSLVNIEALEDAEVLVWRQEYIHKIFQNPPWLMFARKIAEYLYVRKEKREISFLREKAADRYRAFCQEFKDAVQRVPQYHIASYLGITPETLSRIRREITLGPR